MIRRFCWPLLVAVGVLLWMASPALACSTSDTNYFDGFLSADCLAPLPAEMDIDAQGGLRLHTNGAESTQPQWDTDTDFNNGVTDVAPHPTTLFPPVDVKTLSTQGTGTNATLQLPTSALALVRDTTPESVLNPKTAAVPDNEHVDDPSVIKVGSTYYMYFTGVAEDGSPPAIFEASSADGDHWTKLDADPSTPSVRDPVLKPTQGAFDAHGVSGAKVIYDANATPPYRMWYSGQGDVFGRIGYATSTDGTHWTKYDPNTDGVPDFVLDHGRAGARDSFTASDPTVMKDGETWKMWYQGNDSNQNSILYATSTDGITWSKGGAVLEPGQSTSIANGAFAPTVRKTSTGYEMLLGATDNNNATQIDFSTSTDGLTWSAPSPSGGVNPSGTNQDFDSRDLNSPDLFVDPAGGAKQFKLYYSGQSLSDTGIAHSRIGVSERASPTGWNGSTDKGPNADGSVLDIGTPGTAFDSRQASGLAVQVPTAGSYVGFYTGEKSDLVPRLGEATWDGTHTTGTSDWTKVAGAQADGSLLPLGTTGQYDSTGQSDPASYYVHVAGNTDDWHLWFTAHNGSTESIGYASADDAGAANTPPDNTTWTKAASAHLSADGSGFDTTGVSDPYVINDGTNFIMFYTGHNGSNPTEIGRATSATASGTFTQGASSVIAPTGGTFDANGVKDPVVFRDTNAVTTVEWHMLYTGVEVRADGTTVERMGYATSNNLDASTWTDHGLVLDPSQQPYTLDENGVHPQGAFMDDTNSRIDVWYDGVDRDGRTRGGHASVPESSLTGSVENGWATYQLGGVGSGDRDWRTLMPTFSGQDVQIWVSFLQPYSTAGNEHWSAYFPLEPTTTNVESPLNFLLTVEGIRWQARLADPTGTGAPSLDKVVIKHAPVSFFTAGQADTLAITPPSNQTLNSWTSLTLNWSLLLGSGTGGGTVTVLDASGTPIAGHSASLTTPGDVTINLGDLDPKVYPSLKARIALTSNGADTPIVNSLKVSYVTSASVPTVTLTASPLTVNAGQSTTLTGNVQVAGTPVASGSVSILAQPTGSGGFTQVTTATTDSSGNFTTTVTPTVTTTYEAQYKDPITSAVGTSNTQTVTVNQPPPPPPPTLTLTATPAQVVFGQPVALGGNLAQNGAPLASQSVSLLQEPAGTSAFTAFGAATTDASGNYASTVTPQANTTYQANFAGVVTPPTAAVGVHQLVTLAATRKLGTATFKGTVAPAHPNKAVVIQLKKGTSFVTFATAKTGSTSAFSVKKKLKPCGKFQFRAVSAADADHLDGTSLIALVEKHRLAIKVSVKGRTVTITGKVTPLHKSGTVLIKEIKGTKAVKLGKAKITKTSTFKFVKKLAKGRHKLRADMPADKCHFAGSSTVKSIKLR